MDNEFLPKIEIPKSGSIGGEISPESEGRRARPVLRLELGDQFHLRMMEAADNRKLARRAQIVLLSAQGFSTAEIRRRTGASRQTVLRCQQRYREARIEGLERDVPGPGRPRLASKHEKRVMELTRSWAPAGMTRWTGRAMAKEVGISLRSVQRIWARHGVRPCDLGPCGWAEPSYYKTDYSIIDPDERQNDKPHSEADHAARELWESGEMPLLHSDGFKQVEARGCTGS